MGCLELKTVLLSSKLTAIKKYAFNNTKIKNLYVPRGVKTVEDYAFGYEGVNDNYELLNGFTVYTASDAVQKFAGKNG